jgi:RNA 2',3'-cyclic 3'-phosphodiesterase
MAGSTALRLFVAIYPPEESRREMLASLRTLSPPPDLRHRATPVEQLHMTLHFIGEVAERDLGDVAESVRRSASGLDPFELTPRRLVTFPERSRPRLIALETDAPPALLEIQRRLVHRLARSPRAKTGDRFRPHLTLCRFSPSATPQRVEAPVTLPAYRIDRIVLVRSILRPSGSEHVALESTPLSGAG